MTTSQSPIVVDGVFFQLGRTGIARVWMTLLGLWAPTEFGRRLVVIDRARTAPRVPGIRYHDAPALNYADLDGDRRIVQQVCDEVGAAAFISSYYSYPLTTPSVGMVYDMIPEVLGADMNYPMWKQKTLAFQYAQKFTAISESTARDFQRFAGRPVDIQVDYTGCDFVPPTPDEVADFKRRHGITRPYFMTSGTRTSYKNAALFFAGFARFGDARKDYAIVCTGGGELDAQCRALAGDAQVHVVLLDDLDLRCAYAGAISLVYPSRYEGFGLPVLEAMACECPAITSRASSLPEVGGPATLYIDLGKDEEGQMFELLKFVQRPDIRAELVARGRVQARKFTWTAMAEGVERLLAETAAGTVPPRPMATPHTDDQVLRVGTARVCLPAGHALPALQREHKLYQRLPAALAAVLDDGDLAVIAGAGHGATLAAMHSARPGLGLLAIEKDAARFAYLRANAAELGERVQLQHAELGSSAMPSLDVAVAECGALGGAASVRLVACDAGNDGAAILAGAASLCAATRPMLHVSCQIGADDAALDAWRTRLQALLDSGYAGFWLVDNFGNPMLEVTTLRAVDQAFAYLQRQQQRRATRTLYHFELLAFAERDAQRAQQAIELHAKGSGAAGA